MVSNGEYGKMVKRISPPTRKIKNYIFSFVVGGIICTVGQGLRLAYTALGLSEDEITVLVPVSLVTLSGLLTALGVYDKIAVFAGAGTIVPITGFANSVVSSAMEFRSEGKILGTGAQMFRIAGPVIAYGALAAVIYGVIYYIFV